MGIKTTSKILASVISLLSLAAGPVKAQTASVSVDSDAYERTENKRIEREAAKSNEDACRQMLDKARTAKAKFMAACRSGGAGKDPEACSGVLSDCEDMDSPDSADDVSFSGAMVKALGIQIPDMSPGGGGGKGGNRCSSYAYSDFKSELKDLKQAKKDNEKDLRELQEKRVAESEKFTDKKKGIMETLQSNQKDYDDEQFKNQEEERNIERTKKDNLDSYNQKMRELQAKVLEVQNERAAMTITQASMATKYKTDISECESKAVALAEQQKMRTASSLGKMRDKPKEFWKNCVQGVLDARKNQEAAFQLKMKSYDQQVQNLNAQVAELQQNIQLLNQQASQAAADRMNRNQKAMQNFTNKQNQKMQELNETSQQTSTRMAQIEDAINKTNVAIQQSTAEVTDFEKQRPVSKGSKNYREEMSSTQEEWNTNRQCANTCSGTRLEKDCDSLNKSTSKGSSSSKGSSGVK